jgi:Pyruvate flavodoxin/ferredoxin oxidoreductase, thiamine diP-bdg
MSETFSLNAMIENPTVFVIAQRPGPSTGLATWTSQDGLLQAASPTHGEFAHCVIAVRNSQDSFDLMPVSYNLAEQYQIGVIVLTEKQIAEALYTQAPYDLQKAALHDRGLVAQADLKGLKSSDRYDPNAHDGISPVGLLVPAIKWLAAVVPSFDSYAWRDGLEANLVAFLRTCWESERERISADRNLEKDFRVPLTSVVSGGGHAAIALRDHVVSSAIH